MQIIPRGENIWGNIGTSLGELAGEKLGNLLKEKRAEKEKSRFKQTWSKLLGDKRAEELSNFSPEERQMILNNPSFLMELGKENISPREQIGMNALQQQYQQPQQEVQSALQQYFNNPTLGGGQQMKSLFQPQPQQQFGMQPEQQAQQQMPQGQGQIAPEQAQLIADLFSTPEQRKEKALAAKESRAEKALLRKEAHQAQVEADKETKKYFENALDLEKAADFSDIRLKKMENLIKKGGLPISGFYNLFKNLEEKVPAAYGAAAGAFAGNAIVPGIGAAVGGALGGLLSPIGTMLRFAQRQTSPNLEEFEKLSNDFIKDAKAIFGPRITDNDLKAFMATIPTLGQTDSGKLAIIHNMKMFNKASRIRAKAVKDIIRENGNKRPFNLPILVEDRIRPELDKLSQEFSVV